MAPPGTAAVLGAGVAGLQAAAALKNIGVSVKVYTQDNGVGGVWRKNYAGAALQIQRWHYEFPGQPWPEGTPDHPTRQQVHDYIEVYADRQGLLPLLVPNTKVVGLQAASSGGDDPPGARGWRVSFEGPGGRTLTEHFDYVVVATGLFNKPSRPEWATPESLASAGFEGQVVDARDWTDTSAAEGKHVVVVGGGKTAIDVAVVTSKAAASTALVARRAHWWAPRSVLGLIPFEFASYTRWAWALQPPWYAAGAANKAAHRAFGPLVAAAWKLFEALFPLHTGQPRALVPKLGLLEGIYDTIGIVDAPAVRAAFASGRLAGHLGEVASLSGRAITLATGEQLPADVVVLATGYANGDAALLPKDLWAAAGYELGAAPAAAGATDGASAAPPTQWLYRNVLPPGLDNLAFLGLNATFQHALTTGLQAAWLAGVLSGALALPADEEREADTAARKAWQREGFGWRRNNNHVWAQHGKFHDQLVRDLGFAPPHAANPLAYVRNRDFAAALEESARRSAAAAAARGGAPASAAA